MSVHQRLKTGLVALALGAAGVGASGIAHAQAKGPLTFIMVTHSPASDPYWTQVVNGLEQAGKDLGVKVIYRGTDNNLNDPRQQQRNIDAAIASKPDGIIVSDPTPDSLNDSISRASAAGIPVILVNQGGSQVKKVGALTFVGDDPAIQGQIGARQFNALGTKRALVITTPTGAIPFVDARTSGFSGEFKGKTTLAEIPVNNLNDSNRIKTITLTELQKDPTIDTVFSIGSCCISAMIEARNSLGERGKTMRWGTIDVTTGAIDSIKSGELDFALNAQQYAQGYYPVVLLSLYHRQAVMPAGDAFYTGPAVINKANVAKLAAAQPKN